MYIHISWNAPKIKNYPQLVPAILDFRISCYATYPQSPHIMSTKNSLLISISASVSCIIHPDKDRPEALELGVWESEGTIVFPFAFSILPRTQYGGLFLIPRRGLSYTQITRAITGWSIVSGVISPRSRFRSEDKSLPLRRNLKVQFTGGTRTSFLLLCLLPLPRPPLSYQCGGRFMLRRSLCVIFILRRSKPTKGKE